MKKIGTSHPWSIGLAAIAITSVVFADDPCCMPSCYDEIECVTTPYYTGELNIGYFIAVDFLYWFAKESPLTYAVGLETKAINTETSAPHTLSADKFYSLNSKYNAGYRIGVGTTDLCDGWDISIFWTNYTSKRSSSASTAPFNTFLPSALGAESLLNPWTSAALLFEGEPFYFNEIEATWKLRFQQIDVELGRQYWLSPKFTLRPFIGARGVWIQTNFSTLSLKTFSGEGTLSDVSFEDAFKDKVKGIGLVAGVGPNWFFCPCVSLFAQLDASLVWGPYRSKKEENYLFVQTEGATSQALLDSNTEATLKFFSMQSAFDLQIGVRYEISLWSDLLRVLADIGWEHHVWLDYIHRQTTEGAYFRVNGASQITGFGTYDEITSDLGMGGLRVRVRLDF